MASKRHDKREHDEGAGLPFGYVTRVDVPAVAGFGEAPGSASATEAARFDPGVRLTIAPNGRVVIPKDMRDAMALGPDGAVTARIVDGELRLISPRAAIARAQRRLAHLKKPGESVVDEFLAERRAMWGEE